MTTISQTIAFIGLGTMGGPMASNLIRGGYAVIGFDVNKKAVEKHVAAGGRGAASPEEAVVGADIVFTMLPDGPDVERVVLGAADFIPALKPGAILVDMSTIEPSVTKRIGAALEKAGKHMVDSPVGKTADHAIAGTLTLMVGGDPTIVEKVKPALMCMGKDFFYCGPLGSGVAMKLVNNFLASILLVGSIEALVLGTKAGLTIGLMTDVMKTTMAWNNQLAINLPKKALIDDFSLGFMTKLAEKDVRLAVRMAETLDVEAPVGGAMYQSLLEACQKGFAELDVSSVLKMREDQAGVRVRLPAAPAS
jgi:4-hydroxybutyrate dehydrogenase/sulfolactaldehyde 3-reductase